jgi:hypothetical protein
VFVAFAVENKYYRDLLKGQSLYIHANDTSSPPEMNGVKKIPWTREGIRQFIDSL